MLSRASVVIGGFTLLCLSVGAWALGQSGKRVPIGPTRALGSPRTFKNLTLIPVYDSAATKAGNFLTLDEGLRAKVVKVRESKDGGEVNKLYVSNLGDKPVYLMAGEVVLGGQQDRCVGEDVVLLPHKRGVPIAVFCVEHGRWNGMTEFRESAQMVASAGIRADAQAGAFYATRPAAQPAAVGGRPSRTSISGQEVSGDAGIGQAQEKVWAGVARKNRAFKSENDTGTYRATLNMAKGDAGTTIKPYVKALSGSLDADPHLVGMVAAVNGKVIAADIFGSPTLFRKLWMKLLRSYAADAAENASARPKTVLAVTPAMAKEFVVGASDAKTRLTNKTAGSETVRLDAANAVMYRFRAKAVPAAGGSGDADTVTLHENLLKK